MIRIFRPKEKTLEERRLVLAEKISQLKNEGVTSKIQAGSPELTLKKGLLPYDDSIKQND